MRALSLQQPWASLVVLGLKTVENRTWRTPYRGVIVIHASQNRIYDLAPPWAWAEAERLLPQHIALPTGCLIGTVEIVDCQRYRDCADLDTDPFADGPWCWRLRNPRRFKTCIPCPGRPKFFEVPASVLAVGGENEQEKQETRWLLLAEAEQVAEEEAVRETTRRPIRRARG